MLSAPLTNEWRTFSTTNLACQKFWLNGCPGFWHLIKGSPKSSWQKRTWQDLRQTQIVLLSVFLPKMNVGSITLNQRPKGNPCSGSIQLLLLQRRPRWRHLQENVWPLYFGMQKAACSFINYLQKGKTINGEYYAKLLRELQQAIKSKWPGKLTKGVLLHQDNAPAHKSLVAWLWLWTVWSPPHSPDLAPSDYFLFPNLKKHLAGKRYENDDDIISAIENFFEGQEENFHATKIRALQHIWKKCVDCRGDYAEK